MYSCAHDDDKQQKNYCDDDNNIAREKDLQKSLKLVREKIKCFCNMRKKRIDVTRISSWSCRRMIFANYFRINVINFAKPFSSL